MLYQRQIIAYHGCLRARFEDALLRGVTPPLSEEDHDWLGKGVYFWEHGPKRALEWARQKAQRQGKDPEQARVLGAIIQLGNCLDLLDTSATEELSLAHDRFRSVMTDQRQVMPMNSSHASGDVLRRFLDRAVIEFVVDSRSEIQTVRGAFWEGGPAYSGSAIQKKAHIQVAVRDTDCIVGYFRPRILERENFDGQPNDEKD